MQSLPPSKSTWGDTSGDLDAAYAERMFFGKTRAEAQQLFVENAISRQEDLSSMPARCLHFYIHSYMDYLLSEQSRGDSDAASCFISLATWRCDEIRGGGDALVFRVDHVLDHISKRQVWYEADVDIYGEFDELTSKCRAKLNSRKPRT